VTKPQKVLNLSAQGAQESLGQIRAAVQNVDARLVDGRQYLVDNLAVGYGFCKRLGAPGASRCLCQLAALLRRNAARPAVPNHGDSIAPRWPIRAPNLS
jgi:hypothetical protein